MNETETTFRPGETVRLGSSEQALTVVDVGEHTGRVFVTWITEDGSIYASDFDANLLER